MSKFIERKLEEFAKKSKPDNFECNEDGEVVGEHLLIPERYPESEFELDKEKVLNFLRQSLQEQHELFMSCLPYKVKWNDAPEPGEIGRGSYRGNYLREDFWAGYNECISEIKKSLKDKEL